MKPKAGPSTPNNTFSPPKKRKKITSAKEKRLVVTAYSNLYKTWPKGKHCSLKACAQKTADILGLKCKLVTEIIKEYNKNDSGSPLKRAPMKTVDKIQESSNKLTADKNSNTGSRIKFSENDSWSQSPLPTGKSNKLNTVCITSSCKPLAAQWTSFNGTEGSSSPDTGHESPRVKTENAGERDSTKLEHVYACAEERDGTKPAYSYAQLIAQALLAAPARRLTLTQIYNYIADRHLYYDTADKNWHNCVRHTLSLKRCFVKVRREEGSGKGNFWRIDPQSEDKLIDLAFRARAQRPVQPPAPLKSSSSGGAASSASASPREESTADM